MKIDKNIFSEFGDLSETPPSQNTGLTADQALNQDVVDRFQSLLSTFDNLLKSDSSSLMPLASEPDLEQMAQQRLMQASLSGPTGSTPDAPAETEESSGFGATLREAAEEGVVKGAHKLGTIKDKWDPTNYTSTDSEHYGDKDRGKLPENLSSLGGKSGTAIVEGEWKAFEFGQIDERAEGDWGSAWAKGSSHILDVQGRVFYDVGAKDWSINAKVGVQGRVELIGHHYEFGYTTPGIELAGHKIDLTAKVNADAYVGAQGAAYAGISLGKNTYLNIGAEGFAGASASLQGSAALGEFAEARGGVTAWAGVGAKAELNIGFEDGKLNFDLGLGLALGLGIEIDFGFSIDFVEIGEFVVDALSTVGGAIGDAADWVAGAAEDVVDFVGDAAEEVGEFAEDVGEAVVDAAEDVADAVGDAAEAVGDAVSDVFDW